MYLRRGLFLVRWFRFPFLVLPFLREEIKAEWASRSKCWQTDGCSFSCQGVKQGYRLWNQIFIMKARPPWEWDNPILPMKELKCHIKIGAIFENWTSGSSHLMRQKIAPGFSRITEDNKQIQLPYHIAVLALVWGKDYTKSRRKRQREQKRITTHRNGEIWWSEGKAGGFVDVS